MTPSDRPARGIAAERLLKALLLFLSAIPVCAASTFTLQDHLGHTWTNELVVFPVTGPVTGGRLLDAGGNPVPFQVSGDSIAFQANVPAFGRATYRLEKGQAAPTDVRVESGRESIRLTNSLTGIEVPTAAGAYRDGPFLKMRLRSGEWIGGSRLTLNTAIESYTATVVADGPVYAEIACVYRFVGGKAWTVNYRLMSHEPVVLIDETANLADGSTWQLLVSPGFQPNRSLSSVHFGDRENARYRNNALNFNGEANMSLTPWPLWWNPASVAFLGLFRQTADKLVPGDAALDELDSPDVDVEELKSPPEDFLAAAAGRAGLWANPGDDGPGKSLGLYASKAGEVYFSCSLAGPARHWLLAALTTKENLVAPNEMTRVQELMVKHCETPLQEVNQMILEWPAQAEYPRLIKQRSTPPARSPGGDGRLARKLMDPALRIFLGWPSQPSQSVDTVHRCERILNVATCADLLLGADALEPADVRRVLGVHAVQWGRPMLSERDRFGAGDLRYVRAMLAFLAYKLASPDYYSPDRNFRANPNMTTTRSCVIGLLAAMIPDHPKAREWADMCWREIDHELTEWTGPGGGWLESPHYQTGAIAGMILALQSLHNAGFVDRAADPRLVGAIRYLARISTPPDPRCGGKRHFPPAGNTYQSETTGLFSVVATLCDEPALAQELQWTWVQQGRPKNAMHVEFYDDVLFADFEPVGPPAWGSEHFPGSGVVMRHRFPSDRETYLWLLQGRFAEHYDYDGGSFEMWGKGRPLCLDWGYSGRMPAWQHNRVDVGFRGEIKSFAPLPTADYLRSEQAGWCRQLLLVKGEDYFVMRDTISQPAANWWLWLYTTEPVRRAGDVLQMTGTSDVDLDIWVGGDLPSQLTLAPFKPHPQSSQPRPTLDGVPEEDLLDAAPEQPVGNSCSNCIETARVTIDSFDATALAMRPLTQEGLRLPVTMQQPVFTVLYPRLRTAKAATYEELAEGRGVKVVHPGGTDYIFMSATPFEYREGDVSFRGTTGLIQQSVDTVKLTLSEPGEISCGQHAVSGAEPTSRSFSRP